ncbi:hypothetical protein IG631_15121 [Alternaria alternata]|nr:hypothetical protein IG631_15121 [Alternaria alternata]
MLTRHPQPSVLLSTSDRDNGRVQHIPDETVAPVDKGTSVKHLSRAPPCSFHLDLTAHCGSYSI